MRPTVYRRVAETARKEWSRQERQAFVKIGRLVIDRIRLNGVKGDTVGASCFIAPRICIF
jgi:hypothetical protein